MKDAEADTLKQGPEPKAGDDADSDFARQLFIPGETCWRCVRAKRVSVLIDAAAYFAAFKAAALRARRSIIIIGWDIDSRVRLEPDREDIPAPDQLGQFLDHLVANRPGLHVHILAWDFPLIYAGDRELFTGFRLGAMTNRRLRYCLDAVHPVGASHHQKIVVIDDALAFIGGIDFAARRWDTPQHRLDDPHRVDTTGRRYPPFHDMQVALDGEAAATLGELARERWRRATGKRIIRVKGVDSDAAWPEVLSPEFHDVDVAIARTEVSIDGQAPIREVEALHIAAIAAAQRYIYIENQYLTAGCIGEALRESLERDDGPEIVIVLPQESWDWLEQAAMDTRRAKLIARLRAADRFGRLHVYCPVVSDVPIHVHAKVMIFDDRFVRVGSANLANRSMGLDTECDIAIETEESEQVVRVLTRLVGEHLDQEAETVGAAMVETGSLSGAIERLRGREHTLKPIDIPDVTDPAGLADTPLLDPEAPAEAETIFGQLVRAVDWRVAARRLAVAGIVVALVVALAMAWRIGPLSEWIDVENLISWWQRFGDTPLAGIIATGTFVVAGLALVPLTILITAAAVAFGPVLGSAYALIGSILSAIVVYGAGALLGKRWARKFLGSRWSRVGNTLSGRGVLAIAMVRLVPVAPYSVVNFLAGALHVRFVDFSIGTALGLMPGVIALSILGAQIGAVLRDPNWWNVAVLVAVAVGLLVALGFGIRRLQLRHGRRRRFAGSRSS